MAYGMNTVKSNRNVVYRCFFHVVWCPKYRRRVITSLDPRLGNPPVPGDPGPVDVRLRQVIEEVCGQVRVELVELELMPDHVHLLVSVDPQFGVHRLVKLVKGCSSRLLRQEFASLRWRLPALWTNSYFVATVGGAPLEIVKQYVANQRTL